MPYIEYEPKRFQAAALRVIERANAIIEDYMRQGFQLTLRQLYYRFVAADLFERRYSWTGRKWTPDESGTINAEPNYDMLGRVISDARRAGMVDWDAIIDRTRNLQSWTAYDDPSAAVDELAEIYNVDRWADQPYYVECWVEKDALIGVLQAACEPYRTPFFSCRGYTSDSEIWAAGRRLAARVNDDKDVRILFLSDHDPSGVDMTRDVAERLSLFAGRVVNVKRLALTMDQVRRYDPPPNPAKQTDSRFAKYAELYGDESWELDALDPPVIARLVKDAIRPLIDQSAWKVSEQRRDKGRATLRRAAEAILRGTLPKG